MAAGRGRVPLKSSWAFKVARQHDSTLLVHQQLKWGDTDTTEKTVFSEWFFEAPTQAESLTRVISNGQYIRVWKDHSNHIHDHYGNIYIMNGSKIVEKV